MDLPDLQRIPDLVRRTFGGTLAASAVDQFVDFVREGLTSIQHLAEIASRVTKLEESDSDRVRQLSETRAKLSDMSLRLAKIEDQASTHSRELSELRVRFHGATARLARLEDEASLQIRELNELRTVLDHVDDRVPHLDLADLEQHMADNERRIATALAEIKRQLTGERPFNSDQHDGLQAE